MMTKEITVVPTADSIPAVEQFIDDIMEDSEVMPKAAGKIDIAVDEIYSNIVQYSNATSARIICGIDDSNIRITMYDNGDPFDPLSKSDPDTSLSAEERKIGGLGIFMAKKLTDSLQYEPAEAPYINSITIIKMLV